MLFSPGLAVCPPLWKMCINLSLLHYDCLDLPQRSRSSKVKQRSARTVKTRKRDWCGLFIFVKTLFPVNFLDILQGQRAITYHGNLISKSCKSRVTSSKNRKITHHKGWIYWVSQLYQHFTFHSGTGWWKSRLNVGENKLDTACTWHE